MEGNEEGIAFVKSIGMALDAFRDEMFFTNGMYIGEYYYSILKEEDSQKRAVRLRIAANVAKVISNGMALLGIEVPERM